MAWGRAGMGGVPCLPASTTKLSALEVLEFPYRWVDGGSARGVEWVFKGAPRQELRQIKALKGEGLLITGLHYTLSS